jgi:hypothetical protein
MKELQEIREKKNKNKKKYFIKCRFKVKEGA